MSSLTIGLKKTPRVYKLRAFLFLSFVLLSFVHTWLLLRTAAAVATTIISFRSVASILIPAGVVALLCCVSMTLFVSVGITSALIYAVTAFAALALKVGGSPVCLVSARSPRRPFCAFWRFSSAVSGGTRC